MAFVTITYLNLEHALAHNDFKIYMIYITGQQHHLTTRTGTQSAA